MKIEPWSVTKRKNKRVFFKLFKSPATSQVFESQYSNKPNVFLSQNNKTERAKQTSVHYTLVQTRVLPNQSSKTSHVIL